MKRQKGLFLSNKKCYKKEYTLIVCFFVVNNRKICYNKEESINKERNYKMNKIYNNLNIENLIKTEWFNQFEETQQEVIKIGLKENVDVSVYAKKEFTWEQMMEVLWGLEENLDVSIYVNEDFNGSQMKQIRLGLKDNLDVSLYAEPDLSDEQMKKIREKLLKKSTL